MILYRHNNLLSSNILISHNATTPRQLIPTLDFDGNALAFHVHGKQAFEIPLSEVANTAVGTKAEVSLEFAIGRGVRGGEDSLVEMR